MEKFLEYLQKAKNEIQSRKLVQIVLGNQSCDLDSAVSTLALGYFLYCKNKRNSDILVLPILNVDENYFHLRTLTCYLFEKFGINKNSLIFRNQINWTELQQSKLETYLVDHHVLPDEDKVLTNSVVEIFDHRPVNLNELPRNCAMKKLIINPVGSCSTLIANEILNNNEKLMFNELAHLLYSCIIFDTIDLKEENGRVTPTDISIANRLVTKIGPIAKLSFPELWSIHIDISQLSTLDLLYKDLKIVQKIPIPGVPMLVANYLKRPDVITALEQFSNDFETSLILLIGLETGDVEVQRDIGIYFKDLQLKNLIVDCLKQSGKDLNLEEIEINRANLILFKQNNVKLTRKFIVPLLNQVLNE